MTRCIDDYDRQRSTVLKARCLMGAVLVTIIGALMSGPLGIIWVTTGNPLGWALVGASVLLAVSTVLLFLGSRSLVPASNFRITADASV